jgi:hypothetical protein
MKQEANNRGAVGVVMDSYRERNFSVKKLITCVALAAFVTVSAPAFAQSYDPSVGSGNIVPGSKGGMESGTSRPLYNYAPHHHSTRAHER